MGKFSLFLKVFLYNLSDYWPIYATYHFRLSFTIITMEEISKFHFRSSMIQGGNFSIFRLIFIAPMMCFFSQLKRWKYWKSILGIVWENTTPSIGIGPLQLGVVLTFKYLFCIKISWIYHLSISSSEFVKMMTGKWMWGFCVECN